VLPHHYDKFSEKFLPMCQNPENSFCPEYFY
jgi:hypothetical protein